MLRLWKCYKNCLATHPVKTQAISSGLIWGFGEIAVQTVAHTAANLHHLHAHGAFQDHCATLAISLELDKDKDLQIDWRQVARETLFGLGYIGPVGHFWYETLDRITRARLKLKPNSFLFVGAKFAADCLVGPLNELVFLTYMGLCTGKSSAQLMEQYKTRDSPLVQILDGVFPIFLMVKFRFVPVRYQVLSENLFSLVYSCTVSWAKQQEDGQFKSLPTLKEEERKGG